MNQLNHPISDESLNIQPPIYTSKLRGMAVWFGRFITFTQMAFDFLSVQIAFWLSFWVYIGPLAKSSPQSAVEYFWVTIGAGVVYVILLDREKLYERQISLLNIKELKGTFYVGLYAAGVILSASFYIRTASFSRIMLTTALAIAPVTIYVQRLFFYHFHLKFHEKGWSVTNVLIFGAGSIGQHMAKRFFESPALGYRPVAFLDDDKSKFGEYLKWRGRGPKSGLPVLGDETFLQKARSLGVDLVIIAVPSASFERNQKLVDLCLSLGLSYAIVPNAYEKFIQNVEWLEVGGIPLLRKRDRKVSFYYIALKRLFDFVVGLFLLLLLSPMYLIFSILIKLDSKGPIIFKQKRVGLRGKIFSFYKFRSMHGESHQYGLTPKTSTDPRITKVGRWLRRTSLDELPQLYNVLRGDMSLVGPRPEMPFIVEGYSPLERLRLEAKPGITGVWQISADRGAPIHSNLEYDLFYLENRSLLLDIAILIKTMISVLRGIGAI